MKHNSPLQRHIFLPLTCKILKRKHIFSSFLSWLTKGTISYKVSPEKHKDDLRWSRNTRNPYKCMNVMKQDTKDTKEKNAKQRKMKCMQGYLDWSGRCRESIEKKPTLMDWETVEDLSARKKVSRWIEKLLRSYQDKIQKSRWIEYAIRSVVTRRKRGSIELNLLRIYREAVELEEMRFFKEEKHIKINVTSKLLKQGSNQHAKLSKASLNKKKCKAFIIQNTHTHTHTKQV